VALRTLRGHNAGHEGAVAEPVVQRGLVRPVGPLLDVAEVRVVLAHARVEHRHPHLRVGESLPARVRRSSGEADTHSGAALRTLVADTHSGAALRTLVADTHSGAALRTLVADTHSGAALRTLVADTHSGAALRTLVADRVPRPHVVARVTRVHQRRVLHNLTTSTQLFDTPLPASRFIRVCTGCHLGATEALGP
jgi:hypothetical protein